MVGRVSSPRIRVACLSVTSRLSAMVQVLPLQLSSNTINCTSVSKCSKFWMSSRLRTWCASSLTYRTIQLCCQNMRKIIPRWLNRYNLISDSASSIRAWLNRWSTWDSRPHAMATLCFRLPKWHSISTSRVRNLSRVYKIEYWDWRKNWPIPCNKCKLRKWA